MQYSISNNNAAEGKVTLSLKSRHWVARDIVPAETRKTRDVHRPPRCSLQQGRRADGRLLLCHRQRVGLAPNMAQNDEQDLVTVALERESLAMCAFDDALSGERPGYTLTNAVAEVLGLTEDDVPV